MTDRKTQQEITKYNYKYQSRKQRNTEKTKNINAKEGALLTVQTLSLFMIKIWLFYSR